MAASPTFVTKHELTVTYWPLLSTLIHRNIYSICRQSKSTPIYFTQSSIKRPLKHNMNQIILLVSKSGRWCVEEAEEEEEEKKKSHPWWERRRWCLLGFNVQNTSCSFCLRDENKMKQKQKKNVQESATQKATSVWGNVCGGSVSTAGLGSQNAKCTRRFILHHPLTASPRPPPFFFFFYRQRGRSSFHTDGQFYGGCLRCGGPSAGRRRQTEPRRRRCARTHSRQKTFFFLPPLCFHQGT